MYHYNIILCNADKRKEKSALSTHCLKQVDGLLFMGGTVTDELSSAFPDIGCACSMMHDKLDELEAGNCRHRISRGSGAYW